MIETVIKNMEKKQKNKKNPNLFQTYVSAANNAELMRVKQDIQTWHNALIFAEHSFSYNRQELNRLYKDVMLDAQVNAVINIRKNQIKSSVFKVRKDGEVNEKLTDFINKKWFNDFIDISLDSLFYGFTLVNFGDFNGKEFECIKSFERRFVKPEFDIIVRNESDRFGVNYYENETLKEWTLFVGDKFDHGLLNKLSPLYLWKKAALEGWARYATLFGVPPIVVKTRTREDRNLDEMEKFLQNISNNAYGILDLDDEVTNLNTGSVSGQDVFDTMVKKCNEEISKLVLGQTSATDEKNYVGSAEFHKKILDQYANNDLKFIENVINYQLLPHLVKYFNLTEFEDCVILHENNINISEEKRLDSIISLVNSKNYIADPDMLEKQFGIKVSLINNNGNNNTKTD